MIIKRLTLSNFKNFEGTHSIELDIDRNNGKNIILIGGVNGAGKTTLLEAVRLCLFGRKAVDPTISNKEYDQFIIAMRNKNVIEKKEKDFYVQLDIDLEINPGGFPLTLKRFWEIKKQEITEHFLLLHKGEPLEYIPEECWEDYLLSLIPLHVSDFFFFDGEKVKSLAVGDEADRILRESIKDLVGLNLYDSLSNDLYALKSKISRRNISKKDIELELKKKEGVQAKLEEEITTLKEKLKRNLVKLEELEKQKIQLGKELKKKAGAFAQEREKKEERLTKKREEIDKVNDEIKELCGSYLPFIIATPLCNELLQQIKKEKKTKEVLSTKEVWYRLEADFIKSFEKRKKVGDNLNEGEIKIVKSELKRTFKSLLKNIEKKAEIEEIIHDLPPSEVNRIDTFFSQIDKDIKTNLIGVLKKREKYLLETKKIIGKLRQVPDESFVGEYIRQLSSIDTEKELLAKENEKMRIRADELSIDLNLIKENISSIEEKIDVVTEDEEKKNLCDVILKTIADFNEKMINHGTKELEKIVTEKYKELANKGDMVEKILINPSSFSSVLVDYNGSIVKKENISSGEKEIYAISILWGLAKISNLRIPMMIDSPLAKLDNSHVTNILTHFFPNASNQVIILSHDREITKKELNKLNPYVFKTYTLNNNPTNKIQRGYFKSEEGINGK